VAAPRGAVVGHAVPRAYGPRYYSPYASHRYYYPAYRHYPAYRYHYPAYRYYYPYYPSYAYPYVPYYAPYPYYAYPGFSFGFGIGFGIGWSGVVGGSYGYPYASASPARPTPAPYANSNYVPDYSMTARPASPPITYQARRVSASPATNTQSADGTLFVRVRPDDAVILVDGRVVDRQGAEMGASIDLPEGPHQVEIRRQGHSLYARTIDVRSGRPFTLNVSLTRSTDLASR
jgi:hypothetical protein